MAWTHRGSAGCGTSSGPWRARGGRCSSPPTSWPRSSQTADDVVVINKGKSVAQAPLQEIMARSGGGMKVAGPDVRKLGDLLFQQGANVSGDSAEILVKDRTGEQIGRVVAEHQLVISELAPVGLEPRGGLFWSSPDRREARHDAPTRRRDLQAPQHAHVLRPGGRVPGARVDHRDPGDGAGELQPVRPPADRRDDVLGVHPAVRAGARDPGDHERVPARDDHSEPAGGPGSGQARAGQAGRVGPDRPGARPSSPACSST